MTNNNPGTEGRFLNLDALVQYVQVMPNLVNDVKDFQKKVDEGMNAHALSMHQIFRLVTWVKKHCEHMEKEVADLQVDVALLQKKSATSSLRKEDRQSSLSDGGFLSCELIGAQEGGMAWNPAEAENADGQMGLHQEGGFPGELNGAQDTEMTTNAAETQGIYASDEDAEGDSDPEHAGYKEQLA